MNNYMWEAGQLAYRGKRAEASALLENGMRSINEEVQELANRHPADWPMVIAVMEMAVDNMKNGLSIAGKAELALLRSAFGTESRTITTTIEVDQEELKRQMENQKGWEA